MILIIDAGGTKTEAALVDEKNVKKKRFGPGNLFINKEEAIKNIKIAINEFSGYEKAVVFLAGFFNQTNEERKKITDELQKETKVKLEITSDGFLPINHLKDPAVCITLGTGTALAYINESGRGIEFGFGHLIGDPLSGYSLSSKVIFQVLSSGTEKQKKTMFDNFKVNNQEELITMVYSSGKKTTISDQFANFINDKIFKDFIIQAIEWDEKKYMNKRIVNILKEAKTIVLNGSVAKNTYIKTLIKKYTNSNIVELNSSDDLYRSIYKGEIW